MREKKFREEIGKILGESVDPIAVKIHLERTMNEGHPLGYGEVVQYLTNCDGAVPAIKNALETLKTLREDDQSPSNPNTLIIEGSVTGSHADRGRFRRSSASAHWIEETVIHRER